MSTQQERDVKDCVKRLLRQSKISKLERSTAYFDSHARVKCVSRNIDIVHTSSRELSMLSSLQQNGSGCTRLNRTYLVTAEDFDISDTSTTALPITKPRPNLQQSALEYIKLHQLYNEKGIKGIVLVIFYPW
jgi:hypothetical protein